VQVLVLSFLPALIIPTFSPVIAGQIYPEAQALQFALLFLMWGGVAYSVGFLWSTLFGGEFTGTALCVITPVLYRVVISGSSAFQRYPTLNYASFMSGIPYISSPVKVLIDKPLPVTAMFCLVAVSMMLVACSVTVTRRQDF
jgi:hypothetical protein